MPLRTMGGASAEDGDRLRNVDLSLPLGPGLPACETGWQPRPQDFRPRTSGAATRRPRSPESARRAEPPDPSHGVRRERALWARNPETRPLPRRGEADATPTADSGWAGARRNPRRQADALLRRGVGAAGFRDRNTAGGARAARRTLPRNALLHRHSRPLRDIPLRFAESGFTEIFVYDIPAISAVNK